MDIRASEIKVGDRIVRKISNESAHKMSLVSLQMRTHYIDRISGMEPKYANPELDRLILTLIKSPFETEIQYMKRIEYTFENQTEYLVRVKSMLRTETSCIYPFDSTSSLLEETVAHIQQVRSGRDNSIMINIGCRSKNIYVYSSRDIVHIQHRMSSL